MFAMQALTVIIAFLYLAAALLSGIAVGAGVKANISYYRGQVLVGADFTVTKVSASQLNIRSGIHWNTVYEASATRSLRHVKHLRASNAHLAAVYARRSSIQKVGATSNCKTRCFLYRTGWLQFSDGTSKGTRDITVSQSSNLLVSDRSVNYGLCPSELAAAVTDSTWDQHRFNHGAVEALAVESPANHLKSEQAATDVSCLRIYQGQRVHWDMSALAFYSSH